MRDDTQIDICSLLRSIVVAGNTPRGSLVSRQCDVLGHAGSQAFVSILESRTHQSDHLCIAEACARFDFPVARSHYALYIVRWFALAGGWFPYGTMASTATPIPLSVFTRHERGPRAFGGVSRPAQGTSSLVDCIPTLASTRMTLDTARSRAGCCPVDRLERPSRAASHATERTRSVTSLMRNRRIALSRLRWVSNLPLVRCNR